MKKFLYLPIIFFLFLGACQNSTKEKSNSQQEKEDVITVEEIQSIWQAGETTYETGNPLVGIGDRLEAFIEFFGEPDDVAGIHYTFFNGYMYMITQIDNDQSRVFGIIVDFEKTDNPERTLDEALEEFSAFIPTDAELIDLYEVKGPRGIEYYYNSDYIAEVFKYKPESFPETVIGGFSLRLDYAPSSEDLFTGGVITVGYKYEDKEEAGGE